MLSPLYHDPASLACSHRESLFSIAESKSLRSKATLYDVGTTESKSQENRKPKPARNIYPFKINGEKVENIPGQITTAAPMATEGSGR